MDFELTEKEEKAIRALKRVAKIWPDTLWLFSASGSLCVMKKNKEGEQAVIRRGSADSVDDAYIITHIDIENDGGDW